MTAGNHKWDYENEKRIAAVDAPDGCDRNEKSCILCGITKVTILPPHGFPYHEYRVGSAQMVWTRRPECVRVGAEPVKLRDAG